MDMGDNVIIVNDQVQMTGNKALLAHRPPGRDQVHRQVGSAPTPSAW